MFRDDGPSLEMDRGVSEELSERTELDGQDWKRHPKTLTLGIRSNLTAHSAHRSHPLSGSGNDCQADNLKTLGGTIFKKFLAEWGIMNNRGFQCTVLSLTTSNFKLEVEKSDVGQGLGKFLKRGVDVFDLFDGGEEKLIMKSAKSSPRKKGEEEENEEETRFTTLSPPAANKARTTTTMPSSSLHDVSGEDAPLFTKKKKNNVVVVPIAPSSSSRRRREEKVFDREKRWKKSGSARRCTTRNSNPASTRRPFGVYRRIFSKSCERIRKQSLSKLVKMLGLAKRRLYLR